MTHVGYLIAGWGIALSTIGLYAASMLRRGRVLSQRVPIERRRWITTDEVDR